MGDERRFISMKNIVLNKKGVSVLKNAISIFGGDNTIAQIVIGPDNKDFSAYSNEELVPGQLVLVNEGMMIERYFPVVRPADYPFESGEASNAVYCSFNVASKPFAAYLEHVIGLESDLTLTVNESFLTLCVPGVFSIEIPLVADAEEKLPPLLPDEALQFVNVNGEEFATWLSKGSLWAEPKVDEQAMKDRVVLSLFTGGMMCFSSNLKALVQAACPCGVQPHFENLGRKYMELHLSKLPDDEKQAVIKDLGTITEIPAMVEYIKGKGYSFDTYNCSVLKSSLAAMIATSKHVEDVMFIITENYLYLRAGYATCTFTLASTVPSFQGYVANFNQDAPTFTACVDTQALLSAIDLALISTKLDKKPEPITLEVEPERLVLKSAQALSRVIPYVNNNGTEPANVRLDPSLLKAALGSFTGANTSLSFRGENSKFLEITEGNICVADADISTVNYIFSLGKVK